MLQLAEAIKDNKTLKTLDIGGNNIGHEGAKLLAGALKGNKTLKTLELGYNPVATEGAKALVDALKYETEVGKPLPCACGFDVLCIQFVCDCIGASLLVGCTPSC